MVLGSATPSVETMYRAKTGVYGLYTLKNRFNGRALPEVTIADMKQELRAGNGASICAALGKGIDENLASGKQTILFLNRRGASRLVVCVDCGYVPECPRCSVSLTYHAANHRLMCHYCGHSEPILTRCPACGGHLKRVGAGTQQVERELLARWPESPVLRMDADTVSATNSHEVILRRFREEKIPVLVGTQMVAKGLNFENVTLVGVLDADQSLYVDDFRAAETTFSMITQVVGRSGRGASAGRAIIQTMTPDNTVLRLAAQQDYDGFYEMEIALRAMRQCPPFADFFTFTFIGENEQQVMQAAADFGRTLSAILRCPEERQDTILGPAPASIAKINNAYRYRLTLVCHNSKSLRQMIAGYLQAFARNSKNKGVSVFADVNAYQS
ncbi:MAG: primosomal protein N' [Oscillospiraceae bacterium]|nr:primosomal protein N' [Oscillospiraceae bacterium]